MSQSSPKSQCLHTHVQIRPVLSPLQFCASHPAIQLERNMQACDLGEALNKIGIGNKVDEQKLTHGNTIQFRMICVWIVLVEKFFSHGDSGLNARFETVVASGSGKVPVNVIHGRDYLCKVGRWTGKKRCSIFENLERQVSIPIWSRKLNYTPLKCLPTASQSPILGPLSHIFASHLSIAGEFVVRVTVGISKA